MIKGVSSTQNTNKLEMKIYNKEKAIKKINDISSIGVKDIGVFDALGVVFDQEQQMIIENRIFIHMMKMVRCIIII